MAGLLTTHVLDTMHGSPAAGLRIQLWRLGPGGDRHELLKTVYTNASGRTEIPLLQAGAMSVGCYELLFSVREYFSNRAIKLPEPAFLDEVPVRFGIANPEA